jgi:dTMP kinase
MTCAAGGLAPHLTLVLDLHPAQGRARQLQSGKRTDRLDDEDPVFHERVGAAYLSASGPGVHHLDASRAPNEVLARAWEILEASWRQS